MGRFFGIARGERRGAASGAPEITDDRPWYERMLSTSKAAGSLPYLVEGFVEITEAVRRGHAVILKREPCEVADGVTVFDQEQDDVDSVTVLRFSPTTARYAIGDAASASGGIELTPKRLQRYLSAPTRNVGVALGASFT